MAACNKCNTRKNDGLAEEFVQKAPGKRVKSRHGEPVHWDGLTSLFLVLADQGMKLEGYEERWATALRAHVAQAPGHTTTT